MFAQVRLGEKKERELCSTLLYCVFDAVSSSYRRLFESVHPCGQADNPHRSPQDAGEHVSASLKTLLQYLHNPSTFSFHGHCKSMYALT